MKELKKRIKEREVFTSELNYSAFYEQNGIYGARGEYYEGGGNDHYYDRGETNINDDVLF